MLSSQIHLYPMIFFLKKLYNLKFSNMLTCKFLTVHRFWLRNGPACRAPMFKSCFPNILPHVNLTPIQIWHSCGTQFDRTNFGTHFTSTYHRSLNNSQAFKIVPFTPFAFFYYICPSEIFQHYENNSIQGIMLTLS